VYPPSEIFAELVNKNAIKHQKGVPSPQNFHNPYIPSLPKSGENLMDPPPGFSNRVHLWSHPTYFYTLSIMASITHTLCFSLSPVLSLLYTCSNYLNLKVSITHCLSFSLSLSYSLSPPFPLCHRCTVSLILSQFDGLSHTLTFFLSLPSLSPSLSHTCYDRRKILRDYNILSLCYYN
jgi:hypothetical protein